MAAPLGWKDFASGDVLTAADMDGYVMAQIIGVFADATARDAAITSPQEGQHAWLKSDNSLYFYNGSSWEASPVGDITGVTAGSGLTGGGASGAVTLKVDTDAKGDLVVGTGADTSTKLSVGTNTYVLTADSSTASGLVWAAPTTGDITGVTAGTAISGGGTSGTVTVNADVNGASAVTAVATDYVLISDTSDSNNTKKALISDITALAGDITGVTAGTAMSGGGSTGAVTVNVDVNSASAVTAVSTDYVLIADTSDSNNTKKALVSDIATDPIPLILALS